MKTLSTLALLLGVLHANAQTDTIYSNNDKIACTVKEITEDAVKYSYPNEDLVNSMYKTLVKKIVFKSGRTQTFYEATSFKTVNGAENHDNVTISQVEYEVKGLIKMGDVSSKAKGATTISNMERVKERAYKKLKIQAAMLGANVIYLTQQYTEGNKGGNAGSTSTYTTLSGVAYASSLPDFDAFAKKVNGKNYFRTFEKLKLWSNDTDLERAVYVRDFNLFKVTNESGLIMVEGNIEGVKNYNKFRVIHYDDVSFTLVYEDKATIYNIKVNF